MPAVANSRRTSEPWPLWCTCASTSPSRGSPPGFGISVGTTHAYATPVIDLLAARAPGRLRALREAEPEFVLLDGTLTECDRLGNGRADYSAKHRCHGVNVQVVTAPNGEVLWLSPALPGRCHDLTAARAHRIIRICERQGVPILADRAYIGAGAWVTTPARRLARGELTLTQQTVNRALSKARAPVERAVARLKSWRIFRRARCSPNRMDQSPKPSSLWSGNAERPH